MIRYDINLCFGIYAASPEGALQEILDRKMIEDIARKAKLVAERVNLPAMLPTSFLEGTPHDEPPGKFGWQCLVTIKVHD